MRLCKIIIKRKKERERKKEEKKKNPSIQKKIKIY
jgi:hypothetical protein